VTMSEAGSAPLVRVVQSPHDGVVVCRDHLAQLEAGAVVAHVEIPAAQAAFWGHRCLMCGVDAIPGRLCENEGCRRPLHPQWPAIYCCNECALEDV